MIFLHINLVLNNLFIYFGWLVGFMVFSATFKNISVISWRSVLLMEETGGPGENRQPAASQTNLIT
jgi:hypothetical protein